MFCAWLLAFGESASLVSKPTRGAESKLQFVKRIIPAICPLDLI